MAQLTPELQQAYSDAIQILFGGVVESTPDDINDAVVADIDTMIKEISNCSQVLTEAAFKAIYDATVSKAVGYLLSKILDGFVKSKVEGEVNDKLSELLLDWVNKLTANRKFMGCIYQARANWRSQVTIDLLGI
jgi:hypothetical protein